MNFNNSEQESQIQESKPIINNELFININNYDIPIPDMIINEENKQQVQNLSNINFDNTSLSLKPKEIICFQNLLMQKASKLQADYTFAIEYSLSLITIVKLITFLVFDKLIRTFTSQKQRQKHLNDLMLAHIELSNSMKKIQIDSNALSSISLFKKYYDTGIDKIQELIAKKQAKYSSEIQNQIISKGVLAKLEQYISKISGISKDNLKHITKLDNRRLKLIKLYTDKYELNLKNIEAFDNTLDFSSVMENMPDFILVELDLRTFINKIYLKAHIYLNKLKENLKTAIDLVTECVKYNKESTTIFINETNQLYNTDIVIPKDEMLEDKKIDLLLQIDEVYDIKKDEVELNDSLNKTQKLYQNNQRGDKDIINNGDNFFIKHYNSIEEFIDFIISINPHPEPVNYNNLYQCMFEIKRFAGYFSGWINCYMLYSHQKHLIIFDGGISRKYVNIFEVNKVTFKSKQEKNKYYYDIVIKQKGKVMNATSGTFLYDAKNEQTLNEIALIFQNSDISSVTQNSQ